MKNCTDKWRLETVSISLLVYQRRSACKGKNDKLLCEEQSQFIVTCQLKFWSPAPLVYMLLGLILRKSFSVILPMIICYPTKSSVAYLQTIHIF
jgi:hypothetical protein